MTNAQIARARRAVACRGWRLMSGMLMVRVEDGRQYRVATVGIESDAYVPNFADAATLGCLLALVREAWGDPRGCVVPLSGGRWGWKSAMTVDAVLRQPVAVRGDTESEALVAALEAAP